MGQADPTVLVNQRIQMIRCYQLLLLPLAILEHPGILSVQLAPMVQRIQEVQMDQHYLDFPDCQLVQDCRVALQILAGLVNLRVRVARSVQ